MAFCYLLAEVVGDSAVGISGHGVGGGLCHRQWWTKGLRGGGGGAESELLGPGKEPRHLQSSEGCHLAPSINRTPASYPGQE